MTAFTLVEMSVVIMIIALLTAAILKGQSLIYEAKLRAVATEVSNIQTASNSFFAKYSSYPGDLNQATGFFYKVTTAATANGDGDGQIEFVNGSTVYEGYRAWQHMTLAGMVDAKYAGTATTGAATVNTDVPGSNIANAGYFFDYSSVNTAFNGSTAGAYGFSLKNIVILGKAAATSASPLKVTSALKASDAMAVDSKMDDGVPTTGSVRGADGLGATAGDCVTSAKYKILATSFACVMIFKASNQ